MPCKVTQRGLSRLRVALLQRTVALRATRSPSQDAHRRKSFRQLRMRSAKKRQHAMPCGRLSLPAFRFRGSAIVRVSTVSTVCLVDLSEVDKTDPGSASGASTENHRSLPQ